MYEGLVGFPPFDGPDAFAVGYKQVHEPAVPPHTVNSTVPEKLNAIVMKCLAKPPGDRYATALELADALIEYMLLVGASPGDATRAAWLSRQASAK
jgi:serine/threonine protein kinase